MSEEFIEDFDLIITPGVGLPTEITEIVILLVEEFEMLWDSILNKDGGGPEHFIASLLYF